MKLRIRTNYKRTPFRHPDKFGYGDPDAGKFLHRGAQKFNPNHHPAGSPEGGQFASNSGEAYANALAEARKEVVEKGKIDQIEHLVAVDARTGKIIFRSDGVSKQVKVDPATNAKLDNPNESLDIIHNHPPLGPQVQGASLSPPDIQTLTAPGENSVTAVLHDGSYFTATNNGGDIGSLFGDEVSNIFSPPPVTYQWKAMSDAIDVAKSAGKLTEAEAEVIGFHTMWLQAAKDGLMDYSYHLSDPVSQIMNTHKDLITEIMHKVATAAPEEQ